MDSASDYSRNKKLFRNIILIPVSVFPYKKSLFWCSVLVNLIFFLFVTHKLKLRYDRYTLEQQLIHNNPLKKNFPLIRQKAKTFPQKDSLWIFLMAGQSNMAGRALVEPQDTIENPRILTLDPQGNWCYAKEPLHLDEPLFTGLDCGLSFARCLLDSIPAGISIAMIPCAVGNSTLEHWLFNRSVRGIKLLDNFKEKVDLVQSYGNIKAVLWHHGESNAKPNKMTHYATGLHGLIDVFRMTSQLDSLPILVGSLGTFAATKVQQDNWDKLNQSLKEIAKKDRNIHLIHSLGLDHNGDHLHFNSNAQRIMGRRFAEQYWNHYCITAQ